MLASGDPSSATRLARAKEQALELRDAIPQVAAGIATLTDRVVPNLFPNPDRNVFAQTLARAVTIEMPPPKSADVLATSLGALESLGSRNFFEPSITRRVVVVLTDGESVGFDPGEVARQLAKGPGIRLVVVQVRGPNERVFDENGAPEDLYRTHPESAEAIASLAAATGGRSFGEGAAGSAVKAVQDAVGSGPTIRQGRTEQTRALAPYIALLALLPLLFVLPRPGRGLGSALRLFAADELRRARDWKRHQSDYSPRRARARAARQRA